jgi:hypothetical protein
MFKVADKPGLTGSTVDACSVKADWVTVTEAFPVPEAKFESPA